MRPGRTDVRKGKNYKSSSSSGRGTASAYEHNSELTERQNNKYNSYCSQLLIVFLHQDRINANLSRCKCGSGDKVESGVAETMVNRRNAKRISRQVTDPTNFRASHKKGFSKL